jgi:DNA-binding protein H-NS
MAQTYTQIQRQIEALQRQAEKLKHSEVSGVIERIKTAIAHYDLTPEQLFGTSSAGARKATASSAKVAGKTSGAKGLITAAYTDGAGNSWGGRGPRPRWLRDALAAGKSLEEFATSPMFTKRPASAKKKVTSKRKAKQQYRDQAGNQWSGFGPKPGWLKDALAAGKLLEDFAGPSKDS